MLPEPLHPAIVHFPIVLALLLPLAAIGALVAIRRGAVPARAWIFPVGIAAALVLGAWVAIRTGEAEEERVEAVVAEGPIHEHEEAAETFLAISGVALLLAAGGLLGGGAGRAARALTVAAALAVVAAGVRVGERGGDLVYRYGAAGAYADGTASPVARFDDDDE
ncbi:MAG: DUF2231 domain-containing protein [Gemmatimonadota bacterium]|nr:DUF2231 domain-containing protein [Gemmatimonadota bacterium]